MTKIALVLFGQARFADLGAGYFRKLLEENGCTVRIYFHTWSEVDIAKVAPWVKIDAQSILNLDALVQILSPSDYIVSQYKAVEKLGHEMDGSNQSVELAYWIHTQMFFSISEALRLFCAKAHEDFEQVIISRFDFRPQTWRLKGLGYSKGVYSPRLNHNGQFSDWAIAMNMDTAFEINGQTQVIDGLIRESLPKISGETIWKNYLERLGVPIMSFQSGGFLVRDSKFEKKWGRFDSRSTPIQFLFHESLAYIKGFLNFFAKIKLELIRLKRKSRWVKNSPNLN
jgi:hypothetical protein